ncbi:hypothetical protein N7537_005359 [Penicillium hordei]|uniref:Uncharacterized protein n=1 Tax=Penicillium hordei TaxID=40994 RepID=A0AAD6E5Z5_9EURO|nr:uncharacterized protein N7537_005359 [Penicillium hordei]KAJ5602403.1 hypothetical protein N7537_005359 [Penicillium hordei]
MGIPRSILVIEAGELGTYILRAPAHHPHRYDTTISTLLRESSHNAKEPSKADRIESFRKLGITFTPSDLTLDSKGKLTSILICERI